MLAGQVDVLERVVVDVHKPIDVGDEVRQCIVNTIEILAREAAPDIGIGADAEKHGVVLVEKFLERLVFPDAGIQYELDSHTLEEFTPLAHDVFLELEWRNPEREQAADLRIGVEHDRPNALSCKYVCGGKTGRPRPDDRHAFARIDNVGHVGAPPQLDRLVGDVAFDVADADRADTVVERARAFAEPVLRADPAADFGQGICLMR